MRNQAVEHNVAAFSELSLTVCWEGMLSKASTMSNCANLVSSC